MTQPRAEVDLVTEGRTTQARPRTAYSAVARAVDGAATSWRGRRAADSDARAFFARLRVSHVCLPGPILTAAYDPGAPDRCAPLHFEFCLCGPRPRQGSQTFAPEQLLATCHPI